jgi:hypothetical protein
LTVEITHPDHGAALLEPDRATTAQDWLCLSAVIDRCDAVVVDDDNGDERVLGPV